MLRTLRFRSQSSEKLGGESGVEVGHGAQQSLQESLGGLLHCTPGSLHSRVAGVTLFQYDMTLD
jgi:hypothetical protein